ncbi:glycosyltransferase family 39 protein [Candidatus Daviesbacteria bacterium]|nr:glycosyltransferase family 39 protein [Candidatus Daviesbacteria bacterium]
MIKKFQISNFKFQIFLVVIIILAASLRLWNIALNPPGLTWDEAAIGYNAYSLLKTGRDEYGQILPLNFKSFGDYKPGVYIYADVPFVALFGLNELAVRMPSVIAGVFLVLLIYLLVNGLFNNKSLALSVALMLAVSPLAIQFSRPAFESNLAVFLNCLGIFCFIRGLKKSNLFIPAGLFFGLSLFTYQASRIFIPILILGLFLIYKKDLSFKKDLRIGLGIFILFVLLVGTQILVLKQSSRLEAMNYFAYRRSDEQINQIAKEDGYQVSDYKFQILHGEWFAYLKGLTERYLIYFSPKMLFIDGDYSPRHRVPDLGVLYYISALLIPLGIIYLWGRKERGAKLIFFLLAISSMPAVLSRDLISMVRALNLLLPLTILEGAGLYYLLLNIKKFNRFIFISVSLIIFFLISANLVVFLDRYFIHASIKYSQGWLYGYKDLLALQCDQLYFALAKPCLLPEAKGKEIFFSKENLSKYDNILMTDDYGQPYIYYLFYSVYTPDKFQKQAILEQPSIDVGTVRRIDNIAFRHVYWPKDRGLKNSLFIATKEELPDQDIIPYPQYKILKDINFLDGQHAFRVVESE